MQGKITKVLNMKPPEILGMVEEAAGTRMFEERKDKAMKTMAKKDKKVEEIESVSKPSPWGDIPCCKSSHWGRRSTST
jgi:chromosome segregation ATPase